MNIFWVTSDPTEHRASCVMRYRLRAASAMIFSFVLSWVSLREMGRPFPGPSNPLNVVVGQVVLAMALVYLFIAFKCAWERLWLGPVVAAIVIDLVEMFGPRLVSQGIGPLRTASLALWLWSFLVSAIFVASAFGRIRPGQDEKGNTVPSGTMVWKSFFRKRPLTIAACYLIAAVALDWIDLYRQHMAHAWGIVAVDMLFEIFLCAFAAGLTEMAVRFITHNSIVGADRSAKRRSG